MAEKEVKTKVCLRTDSSGNWQTANPVLLRGELGVEIDTGRIKIGDGEKAWSKLSYLVTDSATVDFLNVAYPIGSLKMTTTPDNPGATLGGTWERWGQGRVPLSVDESSEEYSESEKIGGETEHALTVEEMPPHTHGVVMPIGETVSSLKYNGQKNGIDPETYTFETTSAGGGKPHNNMPPFITCYIWKRTA